MFQKIFVLRGVWYDFLHGLLLHKCLFDDQTFGFKIFVPWKRVPCFFNLKLLPFCITSVTYWWFCSYFSPVWKQGAWTKELRSSKGIPYSKYILGYCLSIWSQRRAIPQWGFGFTIDERLFTYGIHLQLRKSSKSYVWQLFYFWLAFIFYFLNTIQSSVARYAFEWLFIFSGNLTLEFHRSFVLISVCFYRTLKNSFFSFIEFNYLQKFTHKWKSSYQVHFVDYQLDMGYTQDSWS